MSASSRYFSNRLLVSIGTSALLVLVIILITGGFVLETGPFRLSSRNPRTPLVIAIAMWTVLAIRGRAALAEALAWVTRFVERCAPAAAAIVAAAAAGAGIAYGTFAASSSDASGYVSESALIASGRTVTAEPLVTQVGWSEAAWAFSPLGYRPGPGTTELVPTYAAGLPLAMAPFRLAGGELAGYLVLPLFGALAVIACYALASTLHSRAAGLVAAMLMATSPIFLFQLMQPMSDVPATAMWAVAFFLAVLRVPGAPLAAGASAGFALLIRPNLIPLAVCAMAAVSGWPSTGGPVAAARGRLLAFAAGLFPALGAQALLQWRLYGSPLASGYGTFGELYALSNIGANLRGYAWRMVSGETAALALLFASLLLLAVRRRQASNAPSVLPAATLAAVALGAILLCYLAYGVFIEWSYLRFLLPAFPIAFAFIGALTASALHNATLTVRGVTLLLILTLAGATNLTVARREGAFSIGQFESRYRTAGRYLEAALPPDAVLLTVQHSGSARYYTHRPIVRWDQMPGDLDAVVATIRSLGRRPLFLVEAWEATDLQRRYPGSALARLDWTPRADFGTSVRVRLFDPADRGEPGIVTDRLP